MDCTLLLAYNNVCYVKSIKQQRDAMVATPIIPHFFYAILVVLHGISQRHHEFLPSYHPNHGKSFRRRPVSEFLKRVFRVYVNY